MKHALLVFPVAMGVLAIGSVTPVLFSAAPVQAIQTGSTPVEIDMGWPRTIVDGTTTILMYQPQVDRWEGNQLEAYAAVEATTAGSKNRSYGVVYFTAETAVNKSTRLVKLDNFHVTKSSFPGDPDMARSFEQSIQKNAEGQVRIIALDRLESNLAITKDVNVPSNRLLNNEPPRIIISTERAIMVPIDGKAELRPVSHQSNLMRVINTRALILFDNDTSAYSLYTLGGWFTAKSLEGPWSAASQVPENYNLTRDMLIADKTVDVLSPAETATSAPARTATAPTIYVCTSPAELLRVQGTPQFTPIENTALLYVSNTDSDIFMDSASKEYFVCISGRWFEAASLDGSWSYISGRDLPEEFAKIPQTSLKAGILTSIPGTPQAQEAVIANDVPQTAEISRSTAKLNVLYDGDPRFTPIEGTNIKYAVNTATPVVLAENGVYYACDKGVWYTAIMATGPWDVAESVPESIYTIPPSCPIYYVTFVRIYRATPDEVYCGYTPGYYGTVQSSEGVVDYGTGYNYPAYLGNFWIGYPISYGLGASFGWSPNAGWSLDFGLGYGRRSYGAWNEPLNWGLNQWYNGGNHAIAPTLPPGKSRPTKHSGYGGIASVNVYNQLGSAHIVRPTGNVSGTIARSILSRNNVYATPDGQVYRHDTTGWQQRDGSGWRATNGTPVQQLQRQQQGRVTGAQRYEAFGRQGGVAAPSMPRGGGARRR